MLTEISSRRRGYLARLVREKPLGAVCGSVVLLFLLVALFAGVLAPYGMNETWVGERLVRPSAQFWFGTDNLGRDVFSRVIYGARVSVIVGLAASSLGTAISLFIGLVSGYIGGNFDIVVQRFVDAVMSLPGLVVIIILVTVLGSGMVPVILALSIPGGIVGSRILRSAVIGIKENVYLDAARVVGCSTWRIILRHVLPNIVAPTIILLSIRIPGMMMAEAGLSFLGFGVPPPFPSWGSMIGGAGRIYMLDAPWMPPPFPSWGSMIGGAGRIYMLDAPWIVLWPGLALALVVYNSNIFGDTLRDLLDPRLRGGAGRFDLRAKTQASSDSAAKTIAVNEDNVLEARD